MNPSVLVTVVLITTLFKLTSGNIYVHHIPHRLNVQLTEDHKIGLFRTDHHTSCSRLCLSFSVCKSIAYHKTNSSCILYDVGSPDNLLEVEISPGSVYTDITSWAPELAGSCHLRDCPDNQICLPIRNTTLCQDIDCHSPPAIRFGLVNVTDSKFGQGPGFNVTCYRGYELEGPSSIRCYANGRWSETPVCRRVDCGYPYVQYATNNNYLPPTTYGSSMNVICSTGYELNGTSIIVCQDNGNWSDTQCTLKDCGDPGVVNGVRTSNITTYGSIIDITCDVGYELYGMTTIQCQANGQWSDYPTCLPKDCGFPAISFGSVNNTGNSTDTTYNSTLTFVCDENYILVGSSDIVCQSDGLWSALPECLPVMCFEADCFMFYLGYQLPNYAYCTNAFSGSIIDEQSCITYCGNTLPAFVSVNFDSVNGYCRCLECTFEQYLSGGNGYYTGTGYDLGVLIQP